MNIDPPPNSGANEVTLPALIRQHLEPVTIEPSMELWKVGDIVTRDGTDEHMIVEMCGSYQSDCMVVRCTKEPSRPWAKVGEEEENLLRRYSWVRSGVPNEASPRAP